MVRYVSTVGGRYGRLRGMLAQPMIIGSSAPVRTDR